MVTTWSLSELFVAKLRSTKLISRPETVTTFNGSVANLKVTRIDSDTFAFVVTALATPSGSLYNPETAEKPKSTGKVYSKLFVVRSHLYSSGFSFYQTVSSGATLGPATTPLSL